MKQTSHQALGAALLARRNALGLTPDNLTNAIGITPDQLHAIESGMSAPESSLLARLATYYGITPQASDDIDHLLAQFLQQDSPSRGQLFKDFVSGFTPKT